MILRPSPNFNERPKDIAIDMLVLHYTGMQSAEAALDRLCDPKAEVSAHYLIDENGDVYKLVEEEHRAWHAGVSYWRGETNINDRSIGIELVNPGHEFGYRPFPESQIESLLPLAKDILARHAIPARNVVGHSDIAPTRKLDPGELFDWNLLAYHGIGLWPQKQENKLTEPFGETEFKDSLSRFGYDTSDIQSSTQAFQRHFRPAKVTGNADSETREILAQLCQFL